MKSIYGFIALISLFVRQFYLPNPFECFGEAAWLYNLVAEPVIHAVAFSLVGLVYNKGDFPPLGSLLYLAAYAIITWLLSVMGIFSFAWWWVLFIVVAIIVIGVLLAKLGRWLSGETW